MQTIYHLYGSATSNQDAIVSLDIQKAGAIEAMIIDMAVTAADALNDGAQIEVSFASTRQGQVNDTKAVIGSTAAYQGFLTTGGGSVSKVVAMSGLNIAVGAGERLYMHAYVTGTTTVAAWIYLYVEDGVGFKMGRRV